MSSERKKEIVCVLFLAVFIFFITRGSGKSSKSAQEIFEEVSPSMDISELQECNSVRFKKEFGLNVNDFGSVVYYASDSVMQVKELLVVCLASDEQKDLLMETLESRVEEKCKLFEGYAAEQSALLEKYLLEEKAGVVIFAVCDDSAVLKQAFENAVL